MRQDVICPACKKKAAEGDIFCVECGIDLRTSGAACPACGTPSLPGDAFCTACGARLGQGKGVEAEKVKAAARIAAADEPERAVAGKSARVMNAGETLLTHALIREIAASHEYNSLSPVSALDSAEKRESKIGIPLESSLLDAILRPSKAFYLTARAGNKLSQTILIVRDSICCRWMDKDGTVTVVREKRPRDFIDCIYGDIAGAVSRGGRSTLILDREQIRILKAVNSLGRAVPRAKLKSVFAVYDPLKRLLQADDGLREHLCGLEKMGMIKITGSGNPIITLGVKGGDIVTMLESYDAFYTLQVLTEGQDDFPSVYLILSGGRLFMISNPKNGDDVVVRMLDAADLRAVLNWMWTAARTN
jgi:hypothetical protein